MSSLAKSLPRPISNRLSSPSLSRRLAPIVSKYEIKELPVASIRRPLAASRANDPAKVEALAASIKEIGLQEPIDVLYVDNVYYGFSGCHRYEAHQKLGLEMIKCRVRRATKEVLLAHLR